MSFYAWGLSAHSTPRELAGKTLTRSEAAGTPSIACVQREPAVNGAVGLPAGRLTGARPPSPRSPTRHRWRRRCASCPIISCWQVRVLPAPPRSPAQLRFPGAVGIVFNFPRPCRQRRQTGQSLPRGIRRHRQKCRPRLSARQTLSRRNSRSRTETGSNLDGDGFERRRPDRG